MFQIYYWGAEGIRSGQINCERHRFAAAIVRGYQLRRFDKFLSDIPKAGGVVVACSLSPVDFATPEGAQQTEPDFDVAGWEEDPTLCMVFFQVAKSKDGPDLPQEQRRLLGFDDMKDEEVQQWLRGRRDLRQQAAA